MRGAKTEKGVHIANMAANILDKLGTELLFFDGAMGTQIQKKGLKLGELPELFNILNPGAIQSIHEEYLQAGADFISTNTFGANRLKLKNTGHTPEELISAGVNLAKKAVGKYGGYVALDVGPLGELLAPLGTLSFEEAYGLYKEQMVIGAQCGADAIIIETMTDLQELRIALLAARENTVLPVFCSMSFEENRRTFMGCSAASAAVALEGLADAIGINCSLGPAEILPIAEELAQYTNKPLLIQPNAGLPRVEDGVTVFDVTPEEFSDAMGAYHRMGAAILGGCCGTTPAHIRAVTERFKGMQTVKRAPFAKTAVCSPSKTVVIDSPKVIGERINPTGKKRFKEALLNNDLDYILRQGIEQAEAGADILDVNVGLPEIDEAAMMRQVLPELQSVADLPLQIDSSDPAAIEAGLRLYNGKAIVNSVNGEQQVLDAILPLIQKYGACVIGLTLDEHGIPKKAEERFRIAERILKEAEKHGIPKQDVIIDCLTLTVSAQQEDAAETLKAVRMVKEQLGLKTVLGVSNISFGLPRRDIINEIFLAEALAHGLDLPIINPNAGGMMQVINAHRVLADIDKNAEAFISKYAGTAPAAPIAAQQQTAQPQDGFSGLEDIVIRGLKDEARGATTALLETEQPLDVVNNHLIPALDVVGERYEKNIIFLPQLIQSAETVQAAFEVLRERLSGNSTQISKGTIVLATVKGDIHDIGKNIVKVILENYGYSIIDLGRDVPAATVVDAAVRHGVRLVGLSALMTTTVKSMEETIHALKAALPEVTVFVGGAVLTEEYAMQIGADYYAKDAKASVEIAKKILG